MDKTSVMVMSCYGLWTGQPEQVCGVVGRIQHAVKEKAAKIVRNLTNYQFGYKNKNVNRTNPTQDNRIQLKTIFPHCILLAWLV